MTTRGNAAYEGGSGGGAPRGVIVMRRRTVFSCRTLLLCARRQGGQWRCRLHPVRQRSDPRPGELIVRAWKALARQTLAQCGESQIGSTRFPPRHWKPGPLGGLLFGSPARFIGDLVLQLRMRAEAEDFFAAVERQRGVGEHLRRFADAARPGRNSTAIRKLRWTAL